MFSANWKESLVTYLLDVNGESRGTKYLAKLYEGVLIADNIISYAVSRWPNTGLYGTMIVRIGRAEGETKYVQSKSHIIPYPVTY